LAGVQTDATEYRSSRTRSVVNRMLMLQSVSQQQDENCLEYNAYSTECRNIKTRIVRNGYRCYGV
jgi:Lon protease-like protein